MDLEYAGRNGVKITEDAGAEKAYFEHGDETIEAHTEGTGAPHVLAAADVGVIMTDAGSAALTAHMLPAAAAGKHFHFQVTTTNGIRVVAAAGDDIRVGNQISKAAGYVQATEIGASLDLYALDATHWAARPADLNWIVETA